MRASRPRAWARAATFCWLAGAVVQASGGGLGAPAATAEPVRTAARAEDAGEAQRVVEQGIALDFALLPLGPAAATAAAPASLPTAVAPGAVAAAAPTLQPSHGGAPPLREGTTALFRFRVADTATATPLTALYPAAWMDMVVAAPWVESEPQECRQKIQRFLGGGLFSRPELDLNSYYVLALNDDATITVVDPLFGLGDSKLLALIPLASPGEDWTIAADVGRLFVALPDSRRVAVADLATFKPIADLEVPFRPQRLALQPDGGYLWALGTEKGKRRGSGGPGGSAAEVFDPRTLARVGGIALGRGAHDIAFSDDSRFAFVTNKESGTVSVLDVRRLAVTGEVATGREPVSVAYSSQAKLAYVSHAAGGTIVALDGEQRRVAARLPAEAGLGKIAFAPGGRYAFALNPRADLVHIVDAASMRIVQTAHLEREPDQVAFSAELAYIRHRGSETVLTIPLKAIGTPGGKVSVMDFPGGQKPFGQGARPSPAAAIVKAPGASAVLVANPADRMIYFYQEGMAAPMGGFANYDRQPRAVLVVDRSLRETAPGTYDAVARLPRPGRYDVAFYLDAPRLFHCFEVTVAADPAQQRQRIAALPPRVEYLSPAAAGAVQVGRTFAVRFKLSDPATGAPLRDLDDVTILCFRPPGNRQIRGHATQVSSGTYEAQLKIDTPGAYKLYVSTASRELPFHKSPPLDFEAAAP
ncbi:MAG TPA: YncE family protein [Thermoanaerobaculia bacterium]|nr:YncE family protein [Thermoanaerobaculia bacterium]